MKNDNVSKDTLESYEANRKIRKGWGDIRPTTRVIGDKRKDIKKKEKEKEIRNYE